MLHSKNSEILTISCKINMQDNIDVMNLVKLVMFEQIIIKIIN